MFKTNRFLVAFSLTVFAIGLCLGGMLQLGPIVRAQMGQRVFELRTYTTNEGKLDALHARFRDHTMGFFEKHGMTNIGYWTPQDSPLSQNTLIYIVAHRNREAAQKSWDAFRQDPEWEKVAAESNAQGQIVEGVESVFVDATDYSPLK